MASHEDTSVVFGWLMRTSRLVSQARPLVVTLLLLSAVLNLVVYLTYVSGSLSHNDFRLYYAGAEVGLRYGWSRIYDAGLHQAAVAALHPVGPWYALLTPAPITWLVAPLTVIGYPAAYWVWVAISLALLGVAVIYARPRQYPAALCLLWWAALGPLWFSAYEGQVTILVAAGLLAGWKLLETRRDFLGGAILALALFKPHLVLLLPIALLVSGRKRALMGFLAVGLAEGIGMLVTLHLDGTSAYLTTLLAPQAAGDTARTLGAILGHSPAAFAIQAAVVVAVIVIAAHTRRTRAAWPLVVSAVLGSFLLATYWHPQDYIAIGAAAAIILAAGPRTTGVLMAAAVAVVAGLANPFNSHQNAVGWLLLAAVFLAVMAIQALRALAAPVARRPAAEVPAHGVGVRRVIE
ncbi:MAG TPA: glycosyltransferase family 87 protein [Candidatus Dormibacteraeota bacterium]|nr:glycosyltransferase family 87 protein [Candidatus Dormibacteraeota bacterium]